MRKPDFSTRNRVGSVAMECQSLEVWGLTFTILIMHKSFY